MPVTNTSSINTSLTTDSALSCNREMNNLRSFLQTKEDQIQANLRNGEPTEEQLTSFVRGMSDQMYQIVSQAPITIKNICMVILTCPDTTASSLMTFLYPISLYLSLLWYGVEWFNNYGMGCKTSSKNSFW